MYNEYTARDSNDYAGRWLAPYVRVDFGNKVHTSQWSEVLLSFKGNTKLEKNPLGSVLLRYANNGVLASPSKLLS